MRKGEAMRTINLSVREIERWPAAALAKIEGRMLFPMEDDKHDHPRLRRLCVLSRLGSWAIDQFSPRWQDIERDLIPEMAEALFDEIKGAREDAYRRGYFAGHKLFNYIKDRTAPTDDAFSASLSEAGARVAPHVLPGVAERTLDDIWASYRPVAHFWMAHLLFRREPGDEAFPVGAKDIFDFLLTAETALRAAAELRQERDRISPMRGQEWVLSAEVVEIAAARGKLIF